MNPTTSPISQPRREVHQALQASDSWTHLAVDTVIRPRAEYSHIIPVQGDNNPLARWLDRRAGIDYVLVADDFVHGLSVRVQSGKYAHRNCLTIRWDRQGDGPTLPTEHHKMLAAMEHNALVPRFHLHAFVNSLGKADVPTHLVAYILVDKPALCAWLTATPPGSPGQAGSWWLNQTYDAQAAQVQYFATIPFASVPAAARIACQYFTGDGSSC